MKTSILKTMIDLSLEAGKAIMDIYATDFGVDFKEDKSPLTQADLVANEIITKGLKQAFPTVGILSEESKDNRKRLQIKNTFIIDPIDGTKEFVKKNDEFTVNIGYVTNHVVTLGVVYAPALGVLYYGGDNVDATKCVVEHNQIVSKKKIHVSNKLTNLILLGSRSHKSSKLDELIKHHEDKIKEVTYIGSSYKGCLIAEGAADIYYKYGITNEWDTCAMQAVVESAGGIFRQMDESLMRYNRENTKNEKGFMILNRIENIMK